MSLGLVCLNGVSVLWVRQGHTRLRSAKKEEVTGKRELRDSAEHTIGLPPRASLVRLAHFTFFRKAIRRRLQ